MTNDQDTKEKVITIFYLPELNAPPEQIRTTGRAGYHIHSDENGVLGYRVYADKETTLIPREHVLKIVVAL